MTEGTLDFEELDHRETVIGELSLRRRVEPRLGGRIVYEVKLDDTYLMSSVFTVGETRLATAGITAASGDALDVVVGGLGLGYTAAAALAEPRVRSVLVVEAIGAVIEWHRGRRVPLGAELSESPRCRLVCGDFFALAASEEGFDHEAPGRRFDAILLDIDHSPEALLRHAHRGLYSPGGLGRLSRHLEAGGVFALWSDDPPDERFLGMLRDAFAAADAEVVRFPNPYTGERSSCTVYLATGPA